MIQNNQLNYEFFSQATTEKVLGIFKTSNKGISDERVEELREEYGENVISHGKKTPLIVEILKAYFTPFTIVLIVLAIISFITDYVIVPVAERDLTGVLIITAMVALSGTMTLIQSVRSNKAAEKLGNLVKVTATVIRKGQEFELPIEELVCGDMIKLSAGDMIPADIRLCQTKDLFVSQAAMTGESYPVEKKAQYQMIEHSSETDLENIAYMGSNVVSGSALGVVVAVGNRTLFGQIAKDVSEAKTLTSFDIGINKTSWLLIRFMLVMAPAVFLINGLTKGDWLEAFLFGLSVAVGLTPEMLPMIVTTNLVKGASTMAKKGTIIKNLNSIQNFGAIDILCTDKTGTLTQDKIILEYHLDVDGKEDDRVLRHAFFNSYYQTGLKNLMDKAIIDSAEEELDINVKNYNKVDEIPFDFERRRMSVVIEDKNGKTQMITKGAIEEMLEISSYVDYQGKVIPLTEELKGTILRTVDELNEDGLRVIGVSQKTNPSVVGEFSIKDESEMVLIGYLAFLDPPKETTKDALSALKAHGVGVKVLTGDNALVTKSVCKQVGLEHEELVTGSEISKMNDVELKVVAEKYNIFVKLSPAQKTRLVRVLRDSGHTVGFMGDGINDAPAMKEADVGISVDTAVDIAKESADVILLEKDLMILERGILSGRTIFGNIMKYVKMTASSNFGNMFSVVVASIFLPFLPMLPLQLLFLNLIYDISCMSIPWDNMDKEYLEEPKKWDSSSIGSFMKWLGPTSSIFDITTYALMYFVICPAVVGGPYNSLNAEQQVLFVAVFHAGWFVESLWSQTLVIHTLRTPKMPFLQSNASFILTTVTTIGIAIGTILPFTAFGERLDLAPLPSSYWGWLAITIVAYLVLVMFVKKLYVKRFGELL
ncbi:magnesium-translocating P-type ATPase [Vagococcus carniphilus]|nr:magnesium-translocating P-type ATPase [Vagococcus carniphilus]MDT2814304.1 magnesium-translocating P-type ATPase [Vagococcus carniphilus]MDT2829422.1 magnesium-translocating P-type ATPase [Vagococcus carniphilus]MDT2838881.1 magnesium-translocating P-type ATPase [Vagococcus carniphilus]MDT2852939.1 magnesium-translocating P-type ATPase [Vagococcus carniphilus]MDT2864491.1 magnesium-translocating P-type ATPase [Vagococcus carniphilus]